ncbi:MULTISPECIES: DUF6233 domain-containing protein [unclassified Streptomyces]|uniref:DUF6233 domain-containing protein n=1 Tax=unclassified Streptomyces TaxID=2593676 RepID=UPI0004CAC6BA|nr:MULTISPECIES: DUF6233 domain-containing protein [unclassified Streptomyces]KJY17266.1 hypothetical protein VR43_30610 [Streptomyces sp. NRRL S-104]
MSVLPPDLPRLQTLVTYLRGELGRAERALTAAEEREAAAVRQQPAPEPPAWLVERGIGAGRLPARLHTGDCWDTGKRCVPAAAEQVRQLLAQGVPACIHCRPDTALGVLE